MRYSTRTAQLDIIDYMLRSENEIPLLDFSMTEREIAPEQLQHEGNFSMSPAHIDEEEALMQQVENANRFRDTMH